MMQSGFQTDSREQPLVVTTSHRGVYFGYGVPSDAPTIRLVRARMCLYWPEENHGVTGLAAEGPLKGARVGPAAPEIIVRDVVSILKVTVQAVSRWEKEPWTK